MNGAQPGEGVAQRPTFAQRQLERCDLVGSLLELSRGVVQPRRPVARRQVVGGIWILAFRNIYGPQPSALVRLLPVKTSDYLPGCWNVG